MTAPGTILIVDDDPGTCETIGDVLKLRGHAVETVHRGDAALQMLAARPVHVALVDLKLPDISGLDLLDQIKWSSPGTEVIFITGYASLPTAIRAVDGAAFAYVTKPFEMHHLMATVEKALEKLRLTEALRQSEERYRFVTEHITDAVFLLDTEGRLVFGNPQVTALTGYREDELRERTMISLLDEEGAKQAQARIEAVMAGRDVPPLFETRIIRKDGRSVWVEASIKRVVDNGRAVGRLGVARDIGERKRAEEALRQSNQTLHALIDASPLAIIAVGVDGLVQMWNPAAERIFGWRADEAVGRPLPIVSADQRDEDHAHMAGAPFGVALTGVETRRLRKDGALIDVSLSFSALRDATGAVTGVMTIAADITQRRLLEEQLRQAQKLEAIGRLAGGVAHDFNNLLTVIGGRSHIMGWRLPPDHPLRHDIEIIEKTAERAAGLTRQLLAFSRKQVLAPRVLDINEVLGGMDRMLQRLIGEDVELVTLLGSDLGRIKVDPSQIEQVVLNLAVNARDAMPEGGRLTIETRSVDLGGDYVQNHAGVEPGPYVMLAVSDTGHGMDAAVQAQLFVPFFTTKEPGKGTGLGLATVYGIVTQSGGHIWVHSEVGQGSTFNIYLPRLNDPVDAIIGAPALAAAPRGVETILLVEDDDAVRDLARETLESSGYRVLEAAHPEAALRIAETYAGSIDLLLTDVVMPGMSGRVLADRLLPLRSGIKLLFMSGYTADAIVHHGVLDAGTAFLQKPFTPGALARRVREVLDEDR